MIIEFGESVLDGANKLSFQEYSNFASTRKRVMCSDVHDNHTVFTGKGIHGFAALLYGAICHADVVIAIDAPTFLDTANRDMFGDTREFRHGFNREHLDILCHVEPNCSTKFILNESINSIQFIHTERVRLMTRNCVVTDDCINEFYHSDTAISKEQETPVIKTFPRRAGNYNNYYHYWVDHLIPIVKHCKQHSLSNIKLCNADKLVTEYSTRILKEFNISSAMTHDARTETVKGMNPTFVHWDENTTQYAQKLVPHVSDATTDILYVVRPRTKRFIANDTELLDALVERYGGAVKTIRPHELDIFEQIKTFANARAVIGQFGSGLTNCMFMNKGSLCIEIDKTDRKRYGKLCEAFGIKHERYEHVTDFKAHGIDGDRAPVNVTDFMTFVENHLKN